MPGTVRLFAGMFLLLSCAVTLDATAPVPRASSSLTVLNPSGNDIRVSNLKGKVVLLEFMLLDCAHCSRVAQNINVLQHNFGRRGFQAIGVAIEHGIGAPPVTKFAQDTKLGFPLGYTSPENVDRFLGRQDLERFQVPQLVLIDREGTIRAQSHPVGENLLENPAYLSKSIAALLNEENPAAKTEWTALLSTKLIFSFVAILTLVAGCLIRMSQRRQRS